MRKFRFFEEYTDEQLRESAGNVIAIDLGAGSFVQEGGVCYNAVCAAPTAKEPNSPVVTGFFNVEYLGRHCRRVSEAKAREIHPRLFEYLDRIA